MGAPAERLGGIGRIIAAASVEKSREEIDKVIERFSKNYDVKFAFFTNKEVEQIGGEEMNLPPKIRRIIKRKPRPLRGIPDSSTLPPPPDAARQIRIERTYAPREYWAIIRVPYFSDKEKKATPATIVVRSDSMTGNGLFFNPRPWLIIVLVVFGLTALIWFPFVRSLNKSISQLDTATRQIANENFNVRVDESRKDEIGNLGKSVNHLAGRLSGFVNGQKRFLGDISHELNSPLARMTWALSILETRINDEDQKYIDDVREEVELMARLVRELLSYSKAGIKGTEVQLESINLLDITNEVAEREKLHKSIIEIDVGRELNVRANRELLSRAISNVLQNAIRYAGDKESILIKAESRKDDIILRIIDQGEGVPESDLNKLFDPLYRVQKDRARKTGGTGLGLAIVKTCINACEGKVSAKNLKPKGFEIKITLKSA